MVDQPNPYKRDFKGITAEKRAQIDAVLRLFMSEMREIFKVADRLATACNPNKKKSCTTCAFLPRMDKSPGAIPTAYGLLWTIRHDQLFICHDNQWEAWLQKKVDLSNCVKCIGFRVTSTIFPEEVKALAIQRMWDIEEILNQK